VTERAFYNLALMVSRGSNDGQGDLTLSIEDETAFDQDLIGKSPEAIVWEERRFSHLHLRQHLLTKEIDERVFRARYDGQLFNWSTLPPI